MFLARQPCLRPDYKTGSFLSVSFCLIDPEGGFMSQGEVPALSIGIRVAGNDVHSHSEG